MTTLYDLFASSLEKAKHSPLLAKLPDDVKVSVMRLEAAEAWTRLPTLVECVPGLPHLLLADELPTFDALTNHVTNEAPYAVIGPLLSALERIEGCHFSTVELNEIIKKVAGFYYLCNEAKKKRE